MKINSVKTKLKPKPFFVEGKISLLVEHDRGKFISFKIIHGKTEKEFKVKYSKTKVDILGPWKQLEKYWESIK